MQPCVFYAPFRGKGALWASIIRKHLKKNLQWYLDYKSTGLMVSTQTPLGASFWPTSYQDYCTAWRHSSLQTSISNASHNSLKSSSNRFSPCLITRPIQHRTFCLAYYHWRCIMPRTSYLSMQVSSATNLQAKLQQGNFPLKISVRTPGSYTWKNACPNTNLPLHQNA